MSWACFDEAARAAAAAVSRLGGIRPPPRCWSVPCHPAKSSPTMIVMSPIPDGTCETRTRPTPSASWIRRASAMAPVAVRDHARSRVPEQVGVLREDHAVPERHQHRRDILPETGRADPVLDDHGTGLGTPNSRATCRSRSGCIGHGDAPGHRQGGERGDRGAACALQHAAHARDAVRLGEVLLAETDPPAEERLHDRGPACLATLLLAGGAAPRPARRSTGRGPDPGSRRR